MIWIAGGRAIKTFTSSYLALKNSLEGTRAWAHLIELQINTNTTAYMTTHPETLTHNSQVYFPIPAMIGEDSQNIEGELPRLTISVANYQGIAFKAARDNDLSLNNCVLKFVNVSLTNSGDWDAVNMQILGAEFSGEVANFMLGWNFNYDALGPRRIWNRRDFPSIPFNWRRFSAL